MTTTNPTCCNTEVTASLRHPFSRLFALFLCPSFAATSFLVDLPICLISSFRYISSTEPIIIAKKRCGLAAKRTGYVPHLLGKRRYPKYEGSTGLAVRYADLRLRCFMGTFVHAYGRFLRAFCIIRLGATTPAFVECPPTSCAPISNSNQWSESGARAPFNWENNLNISDLYINFGIFEMVLGSEGAAASLPRPRKPSPGR